jgi:hypothetical protein
LWIEARRAPLGKKNELERLERRRYLLVMRRWLVLGTSVLLGIAAFYLWFPRTAELQFANKAHIEGPDIDVHSDRVNNFVERAAHILAEIQQTCAKNNLRFVGTTHFVPTWAQFSPDFLSHIGQTLTTVAVGSDEQNFDLSYENGRLRGYMNRSLEDLPEANLLFDPPDRPKWTKEQAIRVASKFLRIFADPKDARFGAPIADYDHTGSLPYKNKSGSKTYLGCWYVLWPRIDSHGHAFSGDGVKIMFHEGFGPTCVGINLSTPYQEEPGDPISVKDAISYAHDALGGKRRWYTFFSKPHDDSPVVGTSLSIVLPFKDPKGFSSPTADAARLAWVVTFKAPLESPYGYFSVWIDAHTGTPLGRDAM